jgi:subtilisin family serine protease
LTRLRPALAVAAALLLLAASNDPLAEQQWHLDVVRAYDAWEAGRGDGVVVAVLDTGVDVSHPDLRGRTVPGVDLVQRGTPPDDPNGHGTLVAGIVAATADNDRGGAGVAPEARIMPVRVLDEDGVGDGRRVAEGIRWAARNGAQVINLSLADAEVPGLTESTARTVVVRDIEQAIADAYAEGALVVAAAGNDGRDSTPYRGDTPALVVGATDHDDQRWPESNVDERTLLAPGVEIVSTWREHGYAKADGTSFSAPIVAGGAALLFGRGVDVDTVVARLRRTAVDVGFGAGRIDLATAMGVRTNRDAPASRPRPSAAPEPRPGGAGGAEEPVPVAEPLDDPAPTAAPEPEEAAPPATAEPVVPDPSEEPTAEVTEEPVEEEDLALADAPPPPSSLSVGTGGDPQWPVPLAGVLLAANLGGLAVLVSRRSSAGAAR